MGLGGVRRALAGVIAVMGCGLATTANAASGGGAIGELDSSLQPLRDATASDIRSARASQLQIENREVLIDVYVDGSLSRSVATLESQGMDVLATAGSPLPVVEGWLPIGSLGPAARLGATQALTPVLEPILDVGTVTSAGVEAHNLPTAIAAGSNGSGIDVGVISDSINQVAGGIADSQATGDLPANTTALKDDPDGTDEGRAMAEIIYDEAPGLESIKFASGFGGPVSKADSIDQLTQAGVEVIADDVAYLGEPFFQDGTISQAVDRASQDGVVYLASAGNRARQSWEGAFAASGSDPALHDFDPGPGEDTRNCFTAALPGTADPEQAANITIVLQWDEPWGGATSNIDLRLVDPSGALLAESTTLNEAAGGTGLPIEFVAYDNTGATPVTPCVEIERVSGVGSPLLKWIQADDYNAGSPERNTASSAINPDAASAEGSLAIAAVDVADPGRDTPEPFSSRGPVQRLFDDQGNRLTSTEVRVKPSLAAADGVATSVTDFQTFFGTSAAAPSAAGIATVVRSTNPQATVSEVRRVMTDPANGIQCATATPVEDCGAGFILADRAVNALDRTGAVVTGRTKPAEPDGKTGWFTENVTVTWRVADPDSSIESRSGCKKVKVKKDGKRKLRCSALSGGGPGSASVKVKLDAKPPAKPRIKGIKKNKTYPVGQVPSKIKCVSKDKTSGLRSCRIKGVNQSRGKHRIKAVATDFAGNKSKSLLRYRVK